MKRYNIPRYKSFIDEAKQLPSILENVSITAILKIVLCEGRLKACSKRDKFFSSLLFNRHKQQRSRTLRMNLHLRQSGPPSTVSVETVSTNERASA